MKELYEKYSQDWLESLPDEISFWDFYMRSENGCYFYLFVDTVSTDNIEIIAKVMTCGG